MNHVNDWREGRSQAANVSLQLVLLFNGNHLFSWTYLLFIYSANVAAASLFLMS